MSPGFLRTLGARYRAKAAGRSRVELATPADFEILVLAGVTSQTPRRA